MTDMTLNIDIEYLNILMNISKYLIFLDCLTLISLIRY